MAAPKGSTAFQDVLNEWGALRDRAREVLDGREWASFVACVTIFAAAESGKFTAAEWNRTEPEEDLP